MPPTVTDLVRAQIVRRLNEAAAREFEMHTEANDHGTHIEYKLIPRDSEPRTYRLTLEEITDAS